MYSENKSPNGLYVVYTCSNRKWPHKLWAEIDDITDVDNTRRCCDCGKTMYPTYIVDNGEGEERGIQSSEIILKGLVHT